MNNELRNINSNYMPDDKKGFFEEIYEFKLHFVEKFSDLCAKWAAIVFDHPRKIVIIGIIVFLVSLLGYLPGVLVWLDGAENLYTLPNTVAQNDAILHNTIFKDTLTHANFMIITTDPPGGNLFTWENLEKAQQIDNLIRGLSVDPIHGRRVALPALDKYFYDQTSKGRVSYKYNTNINIDDDNNYNANSETVNDYYLTFEDLCAISPFGKCQVQSIFEMGIWDMKKVLPKDSNPELYIIGGNIFNLDKKGFVPDFILGGMKTEKCEKELPTKLLLNILTPDKIKPSSTPGKSIAQIDCVKSVEALNFIYELEDKPEYKIRNLAWMNIFYEVLKDNYHYNGLLINGNAFKSRDDELKNSTSESSDIIFVVFTFIFVISYTALINFSINLYHSKCYAALCGSISALAGIIAGLGFTSLLGVQFVPTVLVTPFLIMGVGTDDIFVLINSYSLLYLESNPRKRCIATFKDCGVSIILTKATSLIAFAIGIQSAYISIRNFCIFSMNGLAFSIFFELTWFMSMLFAESRREFAKVTVPFSKQSSRKAVDSILKNTTTDDSGTNLTTFDLVNARTIHEMKKNSLFKPELNPKYLPDYYNKPITLWKRFINLGNYSYDINDYQPIMPMSTETYKKLLASNHPAIFTEPENNVGLLMRNFFCKYYCPFVLHPISKIVIIVLFIFIILLSINGITKMELGLELKDLSPDNSYLKNYDQYQLNYFGQYDIPVYVFFPFLTDWYMPEALNSLLLLDDILRSRKSTVFFNDPLMRMVTDPELHDIMTSGDKNKFESTLYYELSKLGGKYKQFENDFVWEGTRLIAWKITLFPRGMTGSQERATWMKKIRDDCSTVSNVTYLSQVANHKYNGPSKFISTNNNHISNSLYISENIVQPKFKGSIKFTQNVTPIHGRYASFLPIKAVAWNYMMLFYESDLHLITAVIGSMTTAMISMFVVALILIPDLKTGLLVMFVMTLIDLAVMGFMYYWNVKLQMITMICLVISIGFSIDYSAHICHTFIHCKGKTRNLRAIECVILMGTPVFHGAASTITGIFILGLSTSFIFRLFFKMITMTLVFGVIHGLLLLPVLLSIFGTMPKLTKKDIKYTKQLENIDNGLDKDSNDEEDIENKPNINNSSKATGKISTFFTTNENNVDNNFTSAKERQFINDIKWPDWDAPPKLNNNEVGKNNICFKSNASITKIMREGARAETEKSLQYFNNTKTRKVLSIASLPIFSITPRNSSVSVIQHDTNSAITYGTRNREFNTTSFVDVYMSKKREAEIKKKHSPSTMSIAVLDNVVNKCSLHSVKHKKSINDTKKVIKSFSEMYYDSKKTKCKSKNASIYNTNKFTKESDIINYSNELRSIKMNVKPDAQNQASKNNNSLKDIQPHYLSISSNKHKIKNQNLQLMQNMYENNSIQSKSTISASSRFYLDQLYNIEKLV